MLLTALILAGIAAPPATPDRDAASKEHAAPAEPASHDEIVLVLTGARGGIGSGRYRYPVLERLLTLPEGADVEVRPGRDHLVQGPWWLLAGDGRVATSLAVAGAAAPACDEPEPVTVRRGPLEHLLLLGPPPAFWEELPGRDHPATLRRCHAGEAEALLVGPAAGEPSWTLDRWEVRQGMAVHLGETTHLHVVGVPIGEPARTFEAIRRLLAAHPGSVHVDAGDFLDGASAVVDGQVSLHRPLGVDELRDLGTAVLVPGANELVVGPAAFLEETTGLPYIATNWEAPEALELPALRTLDLSGRRVAFLGLLDPLLAERLPALGEAGVALGDPAAAAAEALASLPEPPDLVVALTTGSPDFLADLRRTLHGVDLLAGDASFATFRVADRSARLLPLPRDRRAAPLTLAMDGLARVRIRPGEAAIEVRTEPIEVPGDAAPDPAAVARITRVRAATYPTYDRPLLVAPVTGLDPASWDKLACEALLAASGADVVLLDRLPPPPRVPGVLTELEVVDAMATLDRVEIHRVPGDRMQRLLDQALGVAEVACGAKPGEKFPKVRGRSLEAERTYLVATTDRARLASPLGALLATSASTYLLDTPSWTPLAGPQGPRTLRGAVLDGLRASRDAAGGPEASTEALLARQPTDRTPELRTRLRQLSLRAERFHGTGTSAYEEVGETLASPDSTLSLAGDLDAALEADSRDLAWDLRAQASYARLAVDGQAAEETADDWRLSTSLQVPRWSLPRERPLRAMPYAELLLDSEFTPSLREDGTPNPWQADLSLTAGLAAARWKALRQLRLGAFVLLDLVETDRPLERGGRLAWETYKTFGPSLRWTTLGDVALYADTADDDASDLRLRAFGESRLVLPLSRWLSTSLYLQGLALQGRVPETAEPAFSWLAGAALEVAGAHVLRR